MAIESQSSPIDSAHSLPESKATPRPARLRAWLTSPEVWLRLSTHALALSLVVAAVWLARQDFSRGWSLALPADLVESNIVQQPVVESTPTPTAAPVQLGEVAEPTAEPGDVQRLADIRTIIPTRPRYEVKKYIVEANDTLFTIASKFNLMPETILWGNSTLAENPNILSVGQELNILPIDGALRVVQPDDTVEKIAKAFHGTAEEIVAFPGNNLDANDPVLEEGQLIIIPGGWRDSITWQLPVVTRAGVGPGGDTSEPGSCRGPYSGPSGTFTFAWPAGNQYLSGTDFLPNGHPGLDIAAGLGAGIYASDTGVIVFAGWSYRGYGNLVIIDHGNGWQTAYAHLSQINVACGGSIYQGQTLGQSGSTGNSTGPHLHFEMRNTTYGRVNPWLYLP